MIRRRRIWRRSDVIERRVWAVAYDWEMRRFRWYNDLVNSMVYLDVWLRRPFRFALEAMAFIGFRLSVLYLYLRKSFVHYRKDKICA